MRERRLIQTSRLRDIKGQHSHHQQLKDTGKVTVKMNKTQRPSQGREKYKQLFTVHSAKVVRQFILSLGKTHQNQRQKILLSWWHGLGKLATYSHRQNTGLQETMAGNLTRSLTKDVLKNIFWDKKRWKASQWLIVRTNAHSEDNLREWSTCLIAWLSTACSDRPSCDPSIYWCRPANFDWTFERTHAHYPLPWCDRWGSSESPQ